MINACSHAFSIGSKLIPSVKSLARNEQQICIEMYDKVWKCAQMTRN